MNSKNAIIKTLRIAIYKKWTVLILLTGMGIGTAYSQSIDSLLSKPVSIAIKGISTYQALNIIGEKANCYFIYDSKDVKSDRKIPPIGVINTPLQNVLTKLLPDSSIRYKVIDKHILIYRNSSPQAERYEVKTDSTGYRIAKGRVFDKESKQPIPFATIAIEKLGLGTISNYDGFFSLRIPNSCGESNIVISHMGYQSLSVPFEIIDGNTYNLYIQPRYIPIQEVFIRNIDAKGIVKSAIEKKTSNYSNANVYLTSFYREGVRRNSNFLSYSEAVFKVFKSEYSQGTEFDQVRLLKSRKLELSNRKDTLIVKLKAGIRGALDLDIIKSMPDFLDPKYMDNYVYTKTDIVAHDSKSAYVISFEQKPFIVEPLYSGTLYIDVEQLTLLSAEFEINTKYVEKSSNLFVLKKDRKITVKPESIQYTVKYRLWNGKYYIHHARGDLAFRVHERRKIFSNTYSLFLEYVSIQIDTLNVQRFARRDAIRPTVIFSEENFVYDANFWGILNTIEPEEDVNKALSKIGPKIESIDEAM